MTWDDVVLEGVTSVEALFAHAAQHFPLWQAGAQALADVIVKDLGEGVRVQYNPARRRSVHAAVDAAAVAARPCFLCPPSFPPGECGIAWRDLVLLPNPYPIVAQHLTIPTREHVPQRLVGRAHDLVALAQALGDTMCVTYNGARCGASAPDHCHFQAGSAAAVAWEHMSSLGRKCVVLEGEDLAARLERAVSHWGEDMCNVLVRGKRAWLYPRRAHRPAVFTAGEVAVSPAVLEMAGILVVPDATSFERLDLATARQVYEDVSPADDEFDTFLAHLRMEQ